jgi:hypothetical protein
VFTNDDSKTCTVAVFSTTATKPQYSVELSTHMPCLQRQPALPPLSPANEFKSLQAPFPLTHTLAFRRHYLAFSGFLAVHPFTRLDMSRESGGCLIGVIDCKPGILTLCVPPPQDICLHTHPYNTHSPASAKSCRFRTVQAPLCVLKARTTTSRSSLSLNPRPIPQSFNSNMFNLSPSLPYNHTPPLSPSLQFLPQSFAPVGLFIWANYFTSDTIMLSSLFLPARVYSWFRAQFGTLKPKGLMASIIREIPT